MHCLVLSKINEMTIAEVKSTVRNAISEQYETESNFLESNSSKLSYKKSALSQKLDYRKDIRLSSLIELIDVLGLELKIVMKRK